MYLDHAKEYPLFARSILELVLKLTNNLVGKLYLQEAIQQINSYTSDPISVSPTYIAMLISLAHKELSTSS